MFFGLHQKVWEMPMIFLFQLSSFSEALEASGG